MTSIVIKSRKKSNLRKFLESKRTSKGESFTHLSIYDKKLNKGYPGTFNIPENAKEEFYDLYYNAVFKNNEEVYLCEKHEDKSPIIIDIDLRYQICKTSKENNFKIYSQTFIENLLSIYMESINYYLDLHENIERYAFVFEKNRDQKYNEVTRKDGLHIMFPYIITKPNIQYLIRNRVLKSKDSILKNIEVTNSIEDIIDEAVIEKNSWMLYGSQKPGCEAYKLTNIYQVGTNHKNDHIQIITEQDKKKIYTVKYLIRKLSIQGHHVETPYKKDRLDDIREFDAIYKQKNRIKSSKTKKYFKNNNFVIPEPPDDIDKIRKYIKILSIERAENYKTWLEVGFCLHNIWSGLLPEWIEFSKRPLQYKYSAQNDCEEKWNQMNEEGLTIGSLRHWCKLDNKRKYDEICQPTIEDLVLKCTNGPIAPSYDVGKVLHEKFKDEFVCTSLKKKKWYEFKSPLWRESDAGINLRIKISNDTVNIFSTSAAYYSNKAASAGDEDPQKEAYLKKGKQLMDISYKLRTTSFKGQVMEESAELFYKHKFYELLDSNKHLIGFKNGIYDLDKMEFRQGKPEDFVSFSTGRDYYDWDDDDPIFEDIQNFLKQVLPKKHVREYVLMLLSTFLSGDTGNELFHIWTGSGGNGKSKLIELFELGLGDYCCKLPITVLTRKRACSNQATPELARTKGKRFACLQEPDENEKIQVGLMKELTGGDTIQARALHTEPIEFKPQFHMVLTCNKLPSIPSDDGGTWRRLRVVEFTSEFVQDPDPKKPNQFKIDHNLTPKLKLWADAFLWMLLNKYYRVFKFGDKQKNISPGLKEPMEVKVATNDYRALNDTYAEFISDHIMEYPKGYLTMQEIFPQFRIWYKEVYPDQKCPPKKDLQKYLEKKFGKTRQRGKIGFRGIDWLEQNNSSDDECIIEDDSKIKEHKNYEIFN